MTAHGFRVRVGDGADLAGVLDLEREAEEAPHWAKSEYDAILNANRVVEGSVRRRLFVAEGGSRLLGFAVGKVLGNGADAVAELESIVVLEAVRRIGIGRALCGAVVSWSKAQTAMALELEVRAGSAGAIALYSSLGFVATGRRGGYYRAPVEDALLMRLDLAKDK